MDLKYYKRYYCSDIENVENFDKALADNFVGWCCHHRKGELIPTKELKASKMYYHRPASELIFLTESEHHSLHTKGKQHSEESKKKMSEAAKGKPKSEEARRKNSESHKGNSYHLGKHHSEEAKRKMSEAWDYDKHFTEEARKKLCRARKGKHWYHNDVENFYCYECPPGCELGMLKRK